jgi:large subunit ribosomal protein L9
VEVILLRDVENVGLRGEVVSVSRGFMRNYLEPRRFAEPATPARVAEVQRREAERAKHEAKTAERAQEIAEVLTKTVLRFEVNAGPQGTLFGSVTPTDIADELWRARKIRVDRRKIDLDEPIKRVGRYEVPIDVFQDVRVDVKTLVVPEGGELPEEEAAEPPPLEAAAEEAAAPAPRGERGLESAEGEASS